jgi:hypothetical protein
MLLNMLIPHFSAFLQFLINCIFRFFDSGCTCGKKTKLMLKTDYLDLYAGTQFPIEYRYSEILTTIFVSLFYSSGMPMLYICDLGYFFFLYWVDKILCKKILKEIF